MAKGEAADNEAYARSGGEAEQALNAIRIVKAFGQESHEASKFKRHLDATDVYTWKQSRSFGISKGIFECALYFIPSYGLLLGGLFVFHQVCLSLNTNFYRLIISILEMIMMVVT